MRKSISEIRRFGQVSLALFVLISAFAFIPVFPIYADPITLYLTPLDAAVGDTVTVAGGHHQRRSQIIPRKTRAGIDDCRRNGNIFDTNHGTASTQREPNHNSVDVGSGDTAIASLTVEPRILVTPAVGSFNDRISVRGVSRLTNTSPCGSKE